MIELQYDHLILLKSIESKVQILMEAVLSLSQKMDTKADGLRHELKQDIAVGCVALTNTALYIQLAHK